MKDKTIRKVIIRLSNQPLECMNRLGIEISPILFPNGKFALSLSKENNTVNLLLPAKKSGEWIEKFKLLTLFISVFKELEQKNLIYVVTREIDDFSELFYAGVDDMKQESNGIKLNVNEILCKGSDGKCSIKVGTTEILVTAFQSTLLYDDLLHFLNSYVFPTKALVQYINHGYMPVEEYYSHKAISVSRYGIVLSIIVAILSPILSVYWSNRTGVTKIDENQFRQLMQSSEKKNDTTIIGVEVFNSRDSIF